MPSERKKKSKRNVNNHSLKRLRVHVFIGPILGSTGNGQWSGGACGSTSAHEHLPRNIGRMEHQLDSRLSLTGYQLGESATTGAERPRRARKVARKCLVIADERTTGPLSPRAHDSPQPNARNGQHDFPFDGVGGPIERSPHCCRMSANSQMGKKTKLVMYRNEPTSARDPSRCTFFIFISTSFRSTGRSLARPYTRAAWSYVAPSVTYISRHDDSVILSAALDGVKVNGGALRMHFRFKTAMRRKK